jgi:nucleotide-binding universal stress UspA family protein
MTQSEEPVPTDSPDEIAIIVAAVDVSGVASGVIETAARMARRAWNSAQLHIVHVFRSGMLDRAPPGGELSDHFSVEAKDNLEHHVRMARRQCSVPVTGHFATGNPAEEILRIAASLSADMIVVGTHDAGGFGRLLVGSVSEVVARKASCSVFVVRTKRDKPHGDD